MWLRHILERRICMGQFDIGKKAVAGKKYKKVELYREILEEIEKDNLELQEKDIAEKISAPRNGTGLAEKLIKTMNFQVWKFDDKFSAFKLLKLLYGIEKEGQYKWETQYYQIEDKAQYTKFKITNVFGKPSLHNVKNRFTEQENEYKILFDKLKEDVESEILEKYKRDVISKLLSIDCWWKNIKDNYISLYMISDEALSNIPQTLKEMKRIERYLDEKIIPKIKNEIYVEEYYEEGVFETFYNVLVANEHLCFDADMIRCCEQTLEVSWIDDCAQKLFLKYEEVKMRDDFIEDIEGQYVLQEEERKSDVNDVLYMIFGQNKLKKSDVKDLFFALKYWKEIKSWILEETDEEKSYLSWFITAIQEIVDVKRKGTKMHVEYYGGKYIYQRLLSALKKPKEAEGVLRLAWLHNCQVRYAINMGGRKLIERKVEIDKRILSIKQKLLRYPNLNDMIMANSLVTRFIYRNTISRQAAKRCGELFVRHIGNYVEIKYAFLNEESEGVNVYDMFRIFIQCPQLLSIIAEMVRVAIKPKGVILEERGKCYRINFMYNELQYNYIFKYDRSTQIFEHINFCEVVSNETAEKIQEIGLADFIKQK